MTVFYPVNHFKAEHNYTGSSWYDFTQDVSGVEVNLREMPGRHTASLSFYNVSMDPSQSSGTHVIKKGDKVRLHAKNLSLGIFRKIGTFKVHRVSVDIDLTRPSGRTNKVTVTLHGMGVAGVSGTGGSSGVDSQEELSNVITGAAFEIDGDGFGSGLTVASSGHVFRTNLVTNPAFTTNTTGWTAGGSTSIARIAAPGGFTASNVLQMTRNTTTGTITASTPSGASGMAVTAGSTYTASGYFKAASTGRSINMTVSWYTAAGAFISTTTPTTGTDNTTLPTRFSATVTAPALAAFGQIGATISSAIATEVHYLTYVLFERASALDSYFDGSTTATDTRTYAWTGTANASTSTATGAFVEVASINTASQLDQVLLTRDSNPGVIAFEDPEGTIQVFDSATARTGAATLSLDDTNYSSIDQKFDMSHIINVLKIKYLEKVRVDKKHTRIVEHPFVYEDSASIAKYGRFAKTIKVHHKSDFAAHATKVFTRNADPENVPASVTIPIITGNDLLRGYEDGHYVGNKVVVTLPDGVTTYTCRIKRIQHIITPTQWRVVVYLRDQNIHEHQRHNAGVTTEVGNNPDGAVLGSHLTDDVDITGKTVSNGTVQTKLDTTSNRIVMRDDGSEGIIEFWAGIPGETKGQINPGIDAGTGNHIIDFRTSHEASGAHDTSARMQLMGGGISGDGGFLKLLNGIELDANFVNCNSLTSGGAIHSTTGGLWMDDLNGGGSTTASIGASGRVIRTTSSIRYKDNVEPLAAEAARKVLDLEPVTFTRKDETDGPTYPGFIAEQAAEVGAELWVNRDADGRPDGIRYAELSAALLLIVREQGQAIADLQADIAELKGVAT